MLTHASTSVSAATEPRYFRTAHRHGRWWFLTPRGQPFFSLGLNHIDSAPLRYAEAGDRWQRRYRNSLERWLKNAVRRDLHSWGFNSVGWTQEVVIIRPTIHRHSPAFSFEEYQWLGLPYCHLLPFAETHQRDAEVRHPDFFSRDFEEWCDYVARSQCARFAKDEKLIGYFYTDCPCWVHPRTHNQWKHPLFDPEKLKTEAGRKELAALATRYCQATHDAIRRHDQHHLILGDRYEAMAPVPDEVLLAARPFVDVFSFQHFGPVAKIRADLARFAELTGKPVLLADSAGMLKQPDGTLRNDPMKYRNTLASREMPACVGFHLCGAISETMLAIAACAAPTKHRTKKPSPASPPPTRRFWPRETHPDHSNSFRAAAGHGQRPFRRRAPQHRPHPRRRSRLWERWLLRGKQGQDAKSRSPGPRGD